MTTLTTLLPLTLAGTALAFAQDPVALPPTPPAATSLWWGDFDDDGRLDAYAAEPDGVGRLLLNLGDGEFEDVSSWQGALTTRSRWFLGGGATLPGRIGAVSSGS